MLVKKKKIVKNAYTKIMSLLYLGVKDQRKRRREEKKDGEVVLRRKRGNWVRVPEAPYL